MAELRIVGTPQPRMPGGPDMATGQAQFREDIKLPRMVYLRTKHSPHAHAIVKKIDTTQAEAMPGVLLVLTGENLPQEFEHLRRGRLRQARNDKKEQFGLFTSASV